MVKDIFRVLNQKCFDYMMKLLEPHKILMRQENENISLQIWFVVQRAGSGLCKFDSWCSVQAQGCANLIRGAACRLRVVPKCVTTLIKRKREMCERKQIFIRMPLLLVSCWTLFFVECPVMES